MKDFLLEIYCEEIPARMQKAAETSFPGIFAKFFEENSVKYDELVCYISPCRIIIGAKLEEEIPEKNIEIKGPRINANEAAIKGFCAKNMVKQEDLVVKAISGQEFFCINKLEPARYVGDILAENIEPLLKSYRWPKSMFWGNHNFEWVRPLRNILCFIGDNLVQLKIDNLKSTNYTFGHKFMSDEKIGIENAQAYYGKLKQEKVIIDRKERKEIILKGLENLCIQNSAKLNIDNDLLEEVAGLCEFPVVLIGEISQKFMELPPEVLVTSMRNHQKYFTANKEDATLAPYFLFVTNLALDNYDEIIAGNKRVLDARLSDALYFYNLDKKIPFDIYLKKLENVIFHRKLGNLREKTERIIEFSVFIDSKINDGEKKELAKLAAKFCKCDLVSEMVAEFPELQGIMGGYYAREQGYEKEISLAIKNHYKPQGAEDEVPSGLAGIIALSDKMDSLVGLMIAGERATGSKDPYALRRLALAVVRIILENKFELSLKELLARAISSYSAPITSEVEIEILKFIEERFVYFLAQKYKKSFINAATDFKENSNIIDILEVIKTLEEASEKGALEELVNLYKRAKNILEDFEGKISVDHSLFQSNSEEKLYIELKNSEDIIHNSLAEKNYRSAIFELLKLRPPLEMFFEENLVNIEDEKISNNRKALLAEITNIFEQFAKFDQL